MIRIEVETNADGFMKIKAEGHTSTDICAAVSTSLQSNVLFLQSLAMQFPDQIQITVKGDTLQ